MFRNNIAFKGICTIILFITMGISHASVPVTLEIGNAQDDPAGGTCSDPDPTFDTRADCEALGECTDGTSPDAESCTAAGVDGGTCSDAACSDGTSITQSACETAGETWTESATQSACETASATWTRAFRRGREPSGLLCCAHSVLELNSCKQVDELSVSR